MALLIGAFLTENRPPKPQQSSAPVSATCSTPATCSSSAAGDPRRLTQQVAAGVVGQFALKAGADVGHAQYIHQEFGQLEGDGRQDAGGAR